MTVYFKLLLFALIAYQFRNINGSQKKWYCENQLSESETSRFDSEKYRHALKGTAILGPYNRIGDSAKVFEVTTDITQLNLTEIPEISSRGELYRIFKYMRDTKFLVDSSGRTRRLSWLYPDEGCYRRAELATREIFAAGMKVPKKIFVLGYPKPINVQTVNTTSRQVTWRYHVALIYRLERSAFILDPAMEPTRPLLLDEWHTAFGGKERDDLRYAICSPTTYGLKNKCSGFQLYEGDMYAKQLPILAKEFKRVKNLGRNPEEELGDNPPWLQKCVPK